MFSKSVSFFFFRISTCIQYKDWKIDVLPLIYNALESEHAIVKDSYGCHCILANFFAKVQEGALKVIPDLCDTIDYAEVQGVLFPRVAVGSPEGSFYFMSLKSDGSLSLRKPGY